MNCTRCECKQCIRDRTFWWWAYVFGIVGFSLAVFSLSGCTPQRTTWTSSVEGWARANGELHPEVVSSLDEFARSIGVTTSASVCKVRIDSRDLGRLSRRGTPTAMFVLADRLIVSPGVLNQPGYHHGNTLDLATAEGWRTLSHEVVGHAIVQYHDRGGAWAIRWLWLPWLRGDRHSEIEAEQEAIVIGRLAWLWFGQRDLSRFEGMR